MGVSCSCFSLRRVFGDTKNAEKLVNSSAQFLFSIMKKFFISLFAMMIATVSFAQNTLVATLTHGDEISMYYGSYAFQNVMKAAVDGDIISLSGGGFQSTNITKAVTIRGTGIDDANATYIINDFTIEIPEGTSNRLSIEGVRISGSFSMRGTLNNAYFVKNYIYRFTTSGIVNNAVFVNCNVRNPFVSSSNKTTLQFINCIIGNFDNKSYSKTSEASFVNCLIHVFQYSASNTYSSTFMNSIIYYDGSSYRYALNESCSATNCVSIGYDAYENLVVSKNNKIINDFSIFKDSDPLNDLTDEAKAKYLGTDGTPVGMYGGTLPYNTTPSYPQITKMNVANKTTADGKLSVEIEVSAAQ